MVMYDIVITMVGQKENFYWFGFIEFCILLLWLMVRDLASLFLGERPHTPLKLPSNCQCLSQTFNCYNVLLNY
jgi:hypothetical protein